MVSIPLTTPAALSAPDDSMSSLCSQLTLSNPDLFSLAASEAIAPDILACLSPVQSILWQLGVSLSAQIRAGHVIYPPRRHLFRALFNHTLATLRVVILGQDPYHRPHQAHGLAFSVPTPLAPPPSLRNILAECRADHLDPATPEVSPIFTPPTARSGDLTPWTQHGIMLLNTSLTVKASQPSSHRSLGWHHVTAHLLGALSQAAPHPLVFILWGRQAGALRPLIHHHRRQPHLILEAPHPSPLSAYKGFLGSRPFSQASAFIRTHQPRATTPDASWL